MPMNAPAPVPAAAPGWHYAPAALALHWLMALLVAGQATLGLYMMSIEDEPGADRYFGLHMSIGLVVLVLVLARLAWRLNHPPAPLPASMPKWEVSAALAVHRLMYACMILLPVTGFLGASYSKSGVVFFGQHVPAWRVPDRDTSELFFDIHQAIVGILVALIVVHSLAAFKHLLVDKDRVFQRMWP
jgi:cytochrome b561